MQTCQQLVPVEALLRRKMTPIPDGTLDESYLYDLAHFLVQVHPFETRSDKHLGHDVQRIPKDLRSDSERRLG